MPSPSLLPARTALPHVAAVVFVLPALCLVMLAAASMAMAQGASLQIRGRNPVLQPDQSSTERRLIRDDGGPIPARHQKVRSGTRKNRQASVRDLHQPETTPPSN